MNDLLLIGITALTTCGIILSVPMLKHVWYAFKNAITRRFTRENEAMDMVDVLLIAQLEERIDELEEMMENVAKNSYRREQNRKNNIRREVRDYLKELSK